MPVAVKCTERPKGEADGSSLVEALFLVRLILFVSSLFVLLFLKRSKRVLKGLTWARKGPIGPEVLLAG